MTNHEAIQFLDNMKHEEAGRAIGNDGFYAELIGYHVEALNMAIKALELTEPEKCGDCISRQAVIDRINKLIEVEKKQGTDDWGYGRERVNAYEAMLHMVKSEYLYPSVEPERKPGKWIPVSERLPEIKRDVLVYLKNGRFFVAALFAEPFPDAAGQCYRWIGEEEISFRFCDVEAWIPLPEKYQESEGE